MNRIPHAESGQAVVTAADAGVRLDQWLHRRRPDLSRARWQALIKDGRVTRNGQTGKSDQRLKEHDVVEFSLPDPVPVAARPEAIPLDILYEDADLLVINKPPGLVVHPAPGHASGTLVNALLHHCRDLAGIGGELRPGIVHRLDRDTSGVMVVAKNEPALAGLAGQFKQHTVKKEYLAMVWGHPRPAAGTVNTLIGRNPHNRKKMSSSPLPPQGREGGPARPRRGRPAVTHYQLVEKFTDMALCRVSIETGRTHQIRVHLSHLGHPVVGDVQYGRARVARRPFPIPRQMLHAQRLAFTHPRLGRAMEFIAPIPTDMLDLIQSQRAG